MTPPIILNPGTDLPFPQSLPDFQRMFPTDDACAKYLEGIRWPSGFVCPWCHVSEQPYRFANRPGVLRCRACKKDVGLTAGTVMERSHTPLSTWFWAAYLVSSLTPGMSAVQFQRQLGLTRYETAFAILHKLRAGMVRPDRDPIGAEFPVELDEVWIGGRTRGEGKGRHHKTLVIGAVEVRHRPPGDAADPIQGKAKPRRGNKYAGRLRLAVVKNRKAATLVGWARENIVARAKVTTDDWGGYDRLCDEGYFHTQVAERGDPAVAEEYLPLIHLVYSNLKAWINGVHHGVGPQHLQAYLNEFVFRFNRRFYPFTSFRSLLGIAGGAESPTYAELFSGHCEHPGDGGHG